MQFLIGLLVYIVVWVLLLVGLGGIMAYYLQLEVFCSERMSEDLTTTGSTAGSIGCIYSVSSGQ